MADQPPSEEQRAQQTKQQSRTADRPSSAKTQDKPNVLTAPELSTPVNTKELSSIESGKQIATAGRGGERNLVIHWVEETWIDGSPYYSCYALSYRIDIRTLPSHGLEVIKEQLSYKKTYTGTGALRTQLIPVAPLGTKGRVIAHDITTGETLEQPWTWILMEGSEGMGFFSQLWKAIKRSFWKSDN